MKTSKPKNMPGILWRPIDLTRNIEEQEEERFEAIFHYYGLNRGIKGDGERLLPRMILERFPKAFVYERPPSDKRIAVSDVAALKQIVDALRAGSEDQLTDPRLKTLGTKVRRWLNHHAKKATQRNLCEAISKLDTGEWKGVKPETLRDHLNRPIGSTARSDHARQQENVRVGKALRKFVKSLDAMLPLNPDDDTVEE